MIGKPIDLFYRLVSDLGDCRSVIEFGSQFGTQLSYAQSSAKRVGVEVHLPYLEEARRRHPSIDFVHADAREYAKGLKCGSFEAVIMIDFCEHLLKTEALDIINRAKEIASKKVIVFVPAGKHPQEIDPHFMGADHWQTHKATWEEHDLSSLGFATTLWEDFHDFHDIPHKRDIPDISKSACYGIWYKT